MGIVLEAKVNTGFLPTLSALSEPSSALAAYYEQNEMLVNETALIMPSVTRKGAELVPNTVRDYVTLFSTDLCTLPASCKLSFQTARSARGAI